MRVAWLCALVACRVAEAVSVSSRRVVARRVLGAASALRTFPVGAATKKYSSEDFRAALAEIKAARQALNAGDALVAAKDFEGLTALVEGGPVSRFDVDANVLVQAPNLVVEDKKAIGTIRRYGVGADVIIMLGGLAEAARDEDAQSAKAYLAKSKAALDEVILIARNGL